MKRFLGLCAVGLLMSGADAAPLAEREVVVPDPASWTMAQKTAPDKWMPAVVPGTVLTTLVRNGLVPDPYWGLNNKIQNHLIPDLSENRDFYTVTYRAKVTIPAAWKKDKTVWMRPEGINYRGGIKLNGQFVAGTVGTFSRKAVDVTEFVKAGVNDLEIEVLPVDVPGQPFQKPWGAPGEWLNGGDGHIGRNVTVLMCAGWDFMFQDGIRDRHAGIWKDVTFFATDMIRLDAPYVRTKLNADMSEAELTLEIDVACAGYTWPDKWEGTLEAEVEGTDVRFSKKLSYLRGGYSTERLTATLKNPKLWWPRNKGEQNLYTLTARFRLPARETYDRVTDKKIPLAACVSDEVKVRFGVRELTSDQSGAGGARQFFVNRRKIFIRGTNWIPEGMLRQDDLRMARELRLTADSGVNLIRLWAGGIVESDAFYRLCDEYGLLVWQEFWVTGDTRHPIDYPLYLDCVAQQVKRIRAHASLAHWTCANESQEVPGCEELVKDLTGTTSWMDASEVDGVHDGSPYFPVNPMSYYEDTASPRGSRVYGFSPEYGTCALPAADQCRKFMPEDLLWPMNADAWKYREGGGFDRMTEYHHQAVNGYGESKTFDEYARKSQAADALSHRCLWETWNLVRNGRATGLLFWYNNTPVPQVGSHAWDYDLDQTASYFAQKNALEPLHAQYEYLSNRVSVVSDVYAAHDLAVRAEVYDFDSRKVWEKEQRVYVPAERCVFAFTIPFSTSTSASASTSTSSLHLTRPHFIKLRLLEGGREIASSFYWRSNSRYEGAQTVTGPCVAGFEALSDLPKTTVKMTRAGKRLTLVNTGKRIAFFAEVQFYKGGKRCVPVFFSDNFVSLLPGETVEIVAEDIPAGAEARLRGWNLE